MKTIQDIAPARTAWDRQLAQLEHARIGFVQVGHRIIQIKGYDNCWYCGKLFLTKNDSFCSDRCDVLADRALNDLRGK